MAQLLWHGLPTVPPGSTAGLPEPVRLKKGSGRPSVSRSGTVRRPCHNEGQSQWHGQETMPQHRHGILTVPQRMFAACGECPCCEEVSWPNPPSRSGAEPPGRLPGDAPDRCGRARFVLILLAVALAARRLSSSVDDVRRPSGATHRGFVPLWVTDYPIAGACRRPFRRRTRSRTPSRDGHYFEPSDHLRDESSPRRANAPPAAHCGRTCDPPRGLNLSSSTYRLTPSRPKKAKWRCYLRTTIRYKLVTAFRSAKCWKR